MSGEITLKAPVAALILVALVASLMVNVMQAVAGAGRVEQTASRGPVVPAGLAAPPAVPAGYTGPLGPNAPRLAAPPAVPPGYTAEGFAAATGRGGSTGTAPAIPPGMMPGR